MYGFSSLGFNLKHTNTPFINIFPHPCITGHVQRTFMDFYVFFTIYENNAFYL